MDQPAPERLQDAYKFRRWQSTLEHNGITLHGVEEIFSRRRHNGEILFSLFLADATAPEGLKLLPVCFLKGGVVSLLVCLTEAETGQEHLLLVRQRRIATGGFICEMIAGMVDGSEDPDEVALREAEEEAGLIVRPDQIRRMNEAPYFASTGTSDEYFYFYACELTLPRAEIEAFHGRELGVASEHERTYTLLASVPEALRLVTNTNGLLHIYLWLESKGRVRTGA
ncbi:MAG: NUDIX hydrolase [Bacteroidia bacterium]|nr:NUDIX hydrolase [Bacteroidia bacterium]